MERNIMVDDVVRCKLCRDPVEGYEHRSIFKFVDSERVQLGSYAKLDCGCEVEDYDLKVDYSMPNHPATMVDTLRHIDVVSFNDGGPHNSNWHECGCEDCEELDEEDEES